MRTILYATLVVCLTAPAYAQQMNILGGTKMKTQDEVDRETKTNSEYQDTMKKLPDQNAKKDPWGAVRNGSTPPADQKQKKAGAKQ